MDSSSYFALYINGQQVVYTSSSYDSGTIYGLSSTDDVFCETMSGGSSYAYANVNGSIETCSYSYCTATTPTVNPDSGGIYASGYTS